MSLLVAGVQVWIVGRACLPHFPEDLQPSLAQTAQGAGVTLAFVAVRLVVLLSPGNFAPTEVGPEVDGGAQMFVAVPTDVDFEDLTGLKADWSGSRQALQTLRTFEYAPIAAQLAQEARRQFGTSAGQ